MRKYSTRNMLIKDQRARNDINGQTDNTIFPLLCQHTNYLFSNSVTIMLLLIITLQYWPCCWQNVPSKQNEDQVHNYSPKKRKKITA